MKAVLYWLAFAFAVTSNTANGAIKEQIRKDDWLQPFSRWEPVPGTGDVGERLLLTPLIRQGKISEARKLAEIENLTDDPKVQAIKSYSGYFTVNETYNSNLFFWFFPAMNHPEDSPVLLWLQGGPGVSSLFGLFTEHGPFFIDADNETLSLNPNSWVMNHSVIYFDQPVGTGFSFTDSDDGYATGQDQVGMDMHTALIQFFTMFPEYQNNSFFVTGESYAGKYVPAVGYAIHKRNPDSEVKINLQGLAIGNGLTDPESMVTEYSALMYDAGLIDDNGRTAIEKNEKLCFQSIQDERWMDAFMYWDMILYDFVTFTGYTFIYNIYYVNDPSTRGSVPVFVQSDRTRTALHVGNTHYSYAEVVYDKLESDIMKTVKPWVEELLDSGLRIMFYNGNFDICVGYPLSRAMFKKLQFNGADEYKQAERQPWMVGPDLAGYYKMGGTFMEVMVRNAGHMVPTDQPVWALDLITRFSRNISLSN